MELLTVIKLNSDVEGIPYPQFKSMWSEGVFDDTFIVKKEFLKGFQIAGVTAQGESNNPFIPKVKKISNGLNLESKGEIYLFKLNEDNNPTGFNQNELRDVCELVSTSGEYGSGLVMLDVTSEQPTVIEDIEGKELDIVRAYLGHHVSIDFKFTTTEGSQEDIKIYIENDFSDVGSLQVNSLATYLFNEKVFGKVLIGGRTSDTPKPLSKDKVKALLKVLNSYIEGSK